MAGRRVLVIAAALGLHALAGFGLSTLASHNHVSTQRTAPLVVQLLEPPVPIAPAAPNQTRPVTAPTPAATRPTPTTEIQSPRKPSPAMAPAPQAAAQPSSPDVVRPPSDSPPAPLAAPAPVLALPAPVAAAPATAAGVQAPSPAGGSRASGESAPAPAQTAATTAGAATAPRRVGPRVDASWSGNAPPAYPLSARRMGEQGTVRLDVHVGPDGGVLEVQVRQSSGSPALDRAASEGVRRWRFRPATLDGQPVAEWYRNWEWVFKLEG